MLNSGKLASIIAGAVKAARIAEPATLYVRSTEIDADGVPSATFKAASVECTPLDISAYRRDAGRIPDTDSDVIIYQRGAGAVPMAGHELAIRGVRYEILSRQSDPASATWTCRLRVLP